MLPQIMPLSWLLLLNIIFFCYFSMINYYSSYLLNFNKENKNNIFINPYSINW